MDTVKKTSTNKEVKAKLIELYDEVFKHNGYGEIKVDVRILRRGQKEIIIHCGKQYRFVVDFNNARAVSPVNGKKPFYGADHTPQAAGNKPQDAGLETEKNLSGKAPEG